MSNSILIYSDKRSNRLTYIGNYVFGNRCGLEVSFTNNPAELDVADCPIINYSFDANLPGILVRPAKLLFEKWPTLQEIDVDSSGEIPLLFSDSNSKFGHDPFAAAFYLLSRYEEYLPFVQDVHNRFLSTASILSKYKAVEVPLVDAYISNIRNELKVNYQHIVLSSESFRDEVTVDVDQLLMYRSKGLARTILGAMSDMISRPKKVPERLSVLLGQSKDPLEVYDEIISKCTSKDIRPIFFFQVGETSQFDLNNPVHIPNVKQRINEIALDSDMGFHPSYFSSENDAQLDLEFERLQSVSNSRISRSRQHYLRYRMPGTFRHLEELGMTSEHSVGFADVNGFRAGTSHPFPFFDLDRDEAGTLMLHPFVFMDICAVRNSENSDVALKSLIKLRDAVKKYGGVFSTVWHPEVLIGLHGSIHAWDLFNHIIEENEV